MKNFVITTVSVFALLNVANAQEAKHEIERPAHVEGKEHCPPQHKHHKHHKHHGHHKHHAHHGHHAQQQRPLAVRVNFPPVNVSTFSACPCEYYQDNKDYGYIWHEGYFYYPHPHGGMLPGYTPHQMHGSFWYPSRLHPHAVYIDKQTMMSHEIFPVEEANWGALHHGKKHLGHKHHGRKHHGHKHHGVKHHAAEAAPAGRELHTGQEMPAHKQEMPSMQK